METHTKATFDRCAADGLLLVCAGHLVRLGVLPGHRLAVAREGKAG